MNLVVVSVPHLDMLGALTLFDDLVECCKRRREAVDSDDTASPGEGRVSDLPSRVAAEHA